MSEQRISLEQLRVGVFVRLELRWMEHPFPFNCFKVKSRSQIEVLKELGVTSVICNPQKSDRPPLSLSSSEKPKQCDLPGEGEDSAAQRIASTSAAIQKCKQERIQHLKEEKKRFRKCEEEFQRTFRQAKRVIKSLTAASIEAASETDDLLQSMVESLLSQQEVVVNLMNVKAMDDGVFYHTLNVALLSLLLGRETGLGEEDLRCLGFGALFHDVGKQRIPKKHIIKRGPLTVPERQLLELHPAYGEEIAGRMEAFPEESLKVIRQHHEMYDGQGYPCRLRGEEISLLARVVAIANTYDNLCNPLDPEEAMTPHEALSHMFCRLKEQFDPKLMSHFIRAMGVYPPGTVVELSNGLIGMVMSSNTRDQLRPNLLIYDPSVPKREAVIFQLEDDPDVTIKRSLRPSQLPSEIFYYLNPRTPMDYFS